MSEIKIKHKITHDFLIEKYLEAKKEPDPKKRKRLIKQVKNLSKHIGCYLAN
jgi:hypothetical protein